MSTSSPADWTSSLVGLVEDGDLKLQSVLQSQETLTTSLQLVRDELKAVLALGEENDRKRDKSVEAKVAALLSRLKAVQATLEKIKAKVSALEGKSAQTTSPQDSFFYRWESMARRTRS
ncbi:hypothetical protein BSKO_06911 [Bryopsis sp. KO-2023]|nr:hypothetical protein BSKO_06911 [Bryopsis sp. KO-2023]